MGFKQERHLPAQCATTTKGQKKKRKPVAKRVKGIEKGGKDLEKDRRTSNGS